VRPGSPARSGTNRPPTRSHIPVASAGSASRRRGAGPAGLFAALTLARFGAPPVVLERGRPVEERAGDVARFWRDGTSTPRATPSSGRGRGTFSTGSSPPGSGTRSWTTSSRRSRSSPDPGARQGREAARGDRPAPSLLPADRAELASLGVPVRFGARVEELSVSQGRFAGFALAGGEEVRSPSSCSRRPLGARHGAAALRARRRDVGEGVRRRVPGGASPGDDRPDPVRADGGEGLPPLRSASRRAPPRAEGSTPSACAPAER